MLVADLTLLGSYYILRVIALAHLDLMILTTVCSLYRRSISIAADTVLPQMHLRR